MLTESRVVARRRLTASVELPSSQSLRRPLEKI